MTIIAIIVAMMWWWWRCDEAIHKYMICPGLTGSKRGHNKKNIPTSSSSHSKSLTILTTEWLLTHSYTFCHARQLQVNIFHFQFHLHRQNQQSQKWAELWRKILVLYCFALLTIFRYACSAHVCSSYPVFGSDFMIHHHYHHQQPHCTTTFAVKMCRLMRLLYCTDSANSCESQLNEELLQFQEITDRWRSQIIYSSIFLLFFLF